jgi:transposase-like protein
MRARTVGGVEQAERVNGRKDHSARRNAAQWARIIEAQRRSDLTVVEFCRRRGIAKATFWYWRKRLVRTGGRAPLAKPLPGFLAVPIVAPAPECIEVDLGTMRVRLEGAAAARVVDAIVARVGSGAE